MIRVNAFIELFGAACYTMYKSGQSGSVKPAHFEYQQDSSLGLLPRVRPEILKKCSTLITMNCFILLFYLKKQTWQGGRSATAISTSRKYQDEIKSLKVEIA